MCRARFEMTKSSNYRAITSQNGLCVRRDFNSGVSSVFYYCSGTPYNTNLNTPSHQRISSRDEARIQPMGQYIEFQQQRAVALHTLLCTPESARFWLWCSRAVRLHSDGVACFEHCNWLCLPSGYILLYMLLFCQSKFAIHKHRARATTTSMKHVFLPRALHILH